MKTVRNHFITKITSLVLAFSILLVSSCSKNDNTITNENFQYSGEDYFNAIYFKKGDLANRIYKNDLKDLKGDNSQSDKEVIQIQHILLSNLMAQNPRFMSEFEIAIKSQNLKEIERIVNIGGELIFDTAKTIHNDDSLKGIRTFQKFVKNIDSKSYVSIDKEACVLYLVAVFAIAVYAAVYFWKIGPRGVALADRDSNTQLYKEQFIYNIYELQQ
ncbi:exported hypothetical protein [Tenacibaculum litopenaei]|uniref:hypothetical protein n=1 Tax=Tenacibaculum litopenaei TaxID=396016 RepID=UPI003895FB75